MTRKSELFGDIARYSSSEQTFTDGDALALQVDSTGALGTTTSAPVSSGQARKGTLFGRYARYNENQLVLQDGDSVALQTDINGNTIVTFG